MSSRTLPLPRERGGFDVAAPPSPGLHLPRLRSWVVFTAAVVVAFFLLILSRTTLDQSAFQVRDLEQQIVLEEQRYWELRVEVARLQAPDRIVGAAEELGLVYPDRVDTVQVRATPRPSSSLEDRWAEIKALLSAHP